jgi:hypothetical protein
MKCERCQNDLAQVAGEVRLDAGRPLLFCPLCGHLMPRVRAAGLFFDEASGRYCAWVDPQKTLTEFTARIGRFTVHVPVRAVDIASCLFPRIVIFREEETGAQEPPNPLHFSPIRPEWQHLIRSCVRRSDTGMRRLGGDAITPGHHGYEVETSDGWVSSLVLVPRLEIANLPGQYGTALMIWPDFVVPEWQQYYVAFYPPSLSAAYGTGRIQSLWRREGARLTPVRLDSHYGEAAFAPAAVVVEWSTPDGLLYQACYRTDCEGAPHFLTPEASAASDVQIGLDFGTSNTAAAYSFKNEEGRARRGLLEIQNRTLRLLPGRVNPAQTWLPQPEGDGKFPTLPSLLYFADAAFAQRLAAPLIAVRDYTIPYFQSGAGDEMARLVSQFKWRKRLPKSLAPQAEELRVLYLRLALELYLAELVALGLQPRAARLVATYPLAFLREDAELHRRSFERVREAVSARTGFRLTLSDALDESHAGHYSNETTNTDVTLYIDVGGGTADVCISRRRGDGQAPEVDIVDSIQFGGEDANRELIEGRITSLNEAQLRQRILQGGSQVYDDLSVFHHSESSLREARTVVNNYRRGLVEIAARFAAAELEVNATARLGLVLYGSGWRTAYHEPDAVKVAAAVRKEVQQRLEQYRERGGHAGVPELECHYPRWPKSVVARGAAMYPLGREPVKVERLTFLLQDVEVFLADEFQSRRLAWTERAPTQLPPGSKITEMRLTNWSQFGFEEQALTDVPDFDLLGCTNLEQIVASPFEYYLSQAYRRRLRPRAAAKA